jgi:hypothetical protein
VAAALGTNPEARYDKTQSAIREIFERLLEFLARFEGFLEAGAVKERDLNSYLDYWMKLISGNDPYRDVRRFVCRYETVAFAEFKG